MQNRHFFTKVPTGQYGIWKRLEEMNNITSISKRPLGKKKS